MLKEIEDFINELADISRKYMWYILGILGLGLTIAVYYFIIAIVK